MTIKAVGMAEAAKIVGVTKSNFTSHRKKFDGPDQCPAPTVQLVATPVWIGPDVTKLERWAKEFAKIRVTRAPRGSQQAADNRLAARRKTQESKKAAPATTTTTPAPAPAKAVAAKKTIPAAAKVVPINGKVHGKATAPSKTKPTKSLFKV